ncbi:MAG: DUF362 domain-containing protein [Candidatus Eisenbacteria bacterium]
MPAKLLDSETRITRRRALGTLGALTAALLVPGTPAGVAGPAELALARNGEAAELTRGALAALGGMKRFISPGSRVVIKPNIGWDRTVEQGANTHPEVVAALVALAREAGAREIKVMDHTCNDPRRCYQRSGIEARAREEGAEVIHLREGRGTEMKVGGELVTVWPVHREVIEADVLINVPVAKHHSLSGASLGMKNWLGAIDGRRNQLHQQIGQASAELAAFFKPALTVLDATRVLLRNGPQGGNPDDVDRPRILMAGVDPVAIEAFGATLLGLTAEDLPQIALAEARGLGQRAWERPGLVSVDLAG